MGSIRARLTTFYAAALLGTLVLFSIAMLMVRREIMLIELQGKVEQQVGRAVSAINLARSTGTEPIVSPRDPLAGPSVSARMGAFLSMLDGYVVVQDSTRYDIYASTSVNSLSIVDRETFGQAARDSMPNRAVRRVQMRSDDLLMASRELVLGDNVRYKVSAALSRQSINLTPPELLATMILVAPLLIAVSIVAAYAIAGRAFRPIDRIIDQVEAITDGRSLHRRLAIGAAGDELARLSSTLNAMIERLELSFGALRRFTADASHELKTPLTVMRADVERAMSPVFTPNEQAVALEEALQQLTRMADLVDSLLTLARADEGRFDLYREPVEMGELTREVVDVAHLLGEDAALTIEAPVVEDVLVMGDVTRLRQLMLNLVTNAIKYTPRGGTVEIMLARVGGEVVLTVRDTGIGIAAADLPYVFERFWRADRVRSRASERGGFGLGLAICRWIAQAHGGTLTVQSRLGRGSTFTVLLPASINPDPLLLDNPLVKDPESVVAIET
ncbi:MAG TPA: ATP-binding protein [Gemmatimonas sp.]|nr:ATP-binding protein [Gemmatimonas sp.]